MILAAVIATPVAAAGVPAFTSGATHGTAARAPNGDHLMLETLKRPLTKGERFAGTLVFERAGPIPVTFTVEGIGAKAPGGAAGPSVAPMTMN